MACSFFGFKTKVRSISGAGSLLPMKPWLAAFLVILSLVASLAPGDIVVGSRALLGAFVKLLSWLCFMATAALFVRLGSEEAVMVKVFSIRSADDKIVWRVVRPIAIFVVNNFPRFQRSLQHLLHYESGSRDPFTSDHEDSVSSTIDASRGSSPVPKTGGAEVKPYWISGRANFAFNSTSVINDHHVILA